MSQRILHFLKRQVLRHDLQDLFHHRFEVFFGKVFVDQTQQDSFDTPYTFDGLGYIEILSHRRLEFFAHLEAVADRRDGLAVLLLVALVVAFVILLALGTAAKGLEVALRGLAAVFAAGLAFVEVRAILVAFAVFLEAVISFSKTKNKATHSE
jgi:hypothetical protein